MSTTGGSYSSESQGSGDRLGKSRKISLFTQTVIVALPFQPGSHIYPVLAEFSSLEQNSLSQAQEAMDTAVYILSAEAGCHCCVFRGSSPGLSRGSVGVGLGLSVSTYS